MNFIAPKGITVTFKDLEPGDVYRLYEYLQRFSAETNKRFAPHSFEKQAIIDLFQYHNEYKGYIGMEEKNDCVVAYAFVKTGYADHDKQRLESYGIQLSNKTDATFAPSVSDDWQGKGIAKQMLRYIVRQLKQRGTRRLILLGGVRKSNDRAVNFYLRNGFQILGIFDYNGPNYDMALQLD